jgi:hypothetical protein
MTATDIHILMMKKYSTKEKISIISDLIKERMFIRGPTSLQMIVDSIQHNAKAGMIKSLQCILGIKRENNKRIYITNN